MASKRVAVPKLLARTEHEIQAAFIARVDLHPVMKHLPIYAVPNFSGRLGKVPPIAAIRQAMKLNAEGRRKGVPDVNIDVARGTFHGARIEFKRSAREYLSPEQVTYHAMLSAQGYVVTVQWDDAAAFAWLTEYLNLKTS